MKNLFLTTGLVLFSLTGIYSQRYVNLFTNGSFNGIKGEDKHGSGWQVGSTPDLNDAYGELQTSYGYLWVKQPIPSHDGGTWQNLYSSREYLEQTVNLEKGVMYTIRLEYAAQGIKTSTYSFDQPVGIQIHINGDVVYTTPYDKTPYTWENACYQFTAQSDQVTIRFAASEDQYVGIDGVSLRKGTYCQAVP